MTIVYRTRYIKLTIVIKSRGHPRVFPDVLSGDGCRARCALRLCSSSDASRGGEQTIAAAINTAAVVAVSTAAITSRIEFVPRITNHAVSDSANRELFLYKSNEQLDVKHSLSYQPWNLKCNINTPFTGFAKG